MDKETKKLILIILLCLLTPIFIGLVIFMFEASRAMDGFMGVIWRGVGELLEIDNPKPRNAGNYVSTNTEPASTEPANTEPANTEPTNPVSTNTEPVIEFNYHKTERGDLDALRMAGVGSFLYFGEYEQDNNEATGKEAIEWLVLDKQEDRMLVISRYGLDRQTYHTEFEEVTWETCSLREWLNSSFYETAFIPEEKRLILTSEASADANPWYGTAGGINTMDQVFLLSTYEANRFFEDDAARTCVGTPYCYAHGTYKDSNYGTCWWWLRSPGYNSYFAANVNSDGSVDLRGDLVDEDIIKYAVRPALWINLKP